MTRLFIVLLAGCLGGCFSLPGSDGPAPGRYALQGPAQTCAPGEHGMAVRVVQVAAGLDTDRIARVQESTGEFSYLRDLRWVDGAGTMVEQRLAADLECRGFVVQTGHRTRTGRSQLLCELRSLELRETAAGNQAVVALSCIYRGEEGAELALVESAREPLARWSGTAAVQALDAAYAKVFADLLARIP